MSGKCTSGFMTAMLTTSNSTYLNHSFFTPS